jgi:SAM-dependent methyltransferase
LLRHSRSRGNVPVDARRRRREWIVRDLLNHTDRAPQSLEWFCCPDCRSELTFTGPVATCSSCGRTANIIASNFLKFLPGEESIARTILRWPTEFVKRLKTWRHDVHCEMIPHEFRQQLTSYGLVRTDGSLTSMGENVLYHVSEFEWQTGRKWLDGALEHDGVGQFGRVLDLGCGAAQTLRLLEPDRSVDLVGVDVDLTSLALGYYFAQVESLPLTLVMATSHALPFKDNSFDLVLTRVALNYMHQKRALSEMVRVLRPEGLLYCRVARFWYDLLRIRHSRSIRDMACRCRDLGYGVVHCLTGWQPMPGSTLRGGYAFVAAFRIARMLNSLGCKVRCVAEIQDSVTFLGQRTQLIVVAQKGPSNEPSVP